AASPINPPTNPMVDSLLACCSCDSAWFDELAPLKEAIALATVLTLNPPAWPDRLVSAGKALRKAFEVRFPRSAPACMSAWSIARSCTPPRGVLARMLALVAAVFWEIAPWAG